MREIFEYFNGPDHNEIESIWKNCVFVFDTNVLLNLYRYTPDTRDSLLGLIKEFRDRVWIPHQVGVEFYKNRISVILEQSEAYSGIKNIISDASEQVFSDLNTKLKKYQRQHPTLDVKDISRKIKGVFEEIINQLEAQEKQHPDLMKDDMIRSRVEKLFAHNIGGAYDQGRYDEIFKEGEQRYRDLIPPGYEDEKEKKDKVTRLSDLKIKDMYGDLIVWKQIMDMAKQEKKPVIFVTGDVKEDWFQKIKGKTQGPRYELLHEFKKITDMNFYMYQTERFMEYAQNYLKERVNESAIQEISNLREEKTKQIDNIYATLSIEQLEELEEILAEYDSYEQVNNKIHINEYIKYEVGDRVSHGKWGTGIVIKTRGDNQNQEVDIAFSKPTGIKKLLARFAPIEKINKE